MSFMLSHNWSHGLEVGLSVGCCHGHVGRANYDRRQVMVECGGDIVPAAKIEADFGCGVLRYAGHGILKCADRGYERLSDGAVKPVR